MKKKIIKEKMKCTQNMIIFVKTLTDKYIGIDVDPKNRIQDVKEKFKIKKPFHHVSKD